MKKNENQKIKNLFFFSSFKIFLILFTFQKNKILCSLIYRLELEMDDCFKEIKINNEVKYSIDSCNWNNRILSFDDFVRNYGDIITFTLRDNCDVTLEDICYIKGYIRINEYKISTSNYSLWDCSNCKYNIIEGKKFKVINNDMLICGTNNNKEIFYYYTFNVPNNFLELRRYVEFDDKTKNF